MPEAEKRRLQAALSDYINSYSGGNGGPRGATESGVASVVRQAQSLLTKLSGGSGDEKKTPGKRSAEAAGGGNTPPQFAKK